tara:strand:- start:513 stop:635 length:123 start_codon:yes stop_codon:yes gene_type:complete
VALTDNGSIADALMASVAEIRVVPIPGRRKRSMAKGVKRA